MNKLFQRFNCLVVENNCDSNGNAGDGAGINLNFGANRIDGNSVLANDRGIDANPATDNIIMRNSAKGNNPNYDIIAGNAAGPIGTVETATSPWANLEY